MAAITVTNADWTILNAVKTALAADTIGGVAIFKAVSITTSEAPFKQRHKTQSPVAAVRYVTSIENQSPEGYRGVVVSCEIIVSAWVNEADLGESARMQEALRLKNAVVNIVETTPPSAQGWGDGDFYHRPVEWGEPTLDVSEPWVTVAIPVEFVYVLTAATAH